MRSLGAPHARWVTAPVIMHVDMDAFFASIEARDRPELRGKPLLVGGGGRRGVVAAASYEARTFGCRSAQPTAVALRKCPHAIVVPPRHTHYVEVSRQVFAVFEDFSPLVEGLSIDEAFLDMSGTERLFGAPRAAAEAIRRRVREETRLTCSVGIASVKFIAKIASAMNKPGGLTEVAPGTELEFLHPLPVGKLWGVGPKARERLEAQGIRTIGDLAAMGPDRLERQFGEHGAHLWRLTQGRDERRVTPGRDAKSLSSEDTYAQDLVGREEVERRLLAQSTRVADRLTRAGLRGRKVHLKIRDTTFKTESRQCTLDSPTAEATTIYAAAKGLLDKVAIEGRRFRLTGVGVSGFGAADQPHQLALPGTEDEGAEEQARSRKLQEVMTGVRGKFGGKALFPAAAQRGGIARGGRTLTRNAAEHDPDED